MAVYRWIYANAKMESDRKDYHVRICDKGLEKYRKILIELSNRLLSVDKRRGEAERQECWFAGYLDENMYVIAAGADQRDFAGIRPDGYRAQHCVCAYGFTEDEIRLYQKNDGIFQPLKEILREIQTKGNDAPAASKEQLDGAEFLKYAETASGHREHQDYNIIKSTKSIDERLWKQSLYYPVMTGIISTEDAKKLLKYFPDGVATVLEDVPVFYGKQTQGQNRFLQKTEPVNNTVKEPYIEAEVQKHSEKQHSELKALRQEQEQAQRQLAEIREQKQRKKKRVRQAAALILCLLFFLLIYWLV